MRDLLLDFGSLKPASAGAYSANQTNFGVTTEDLANLLPAVLVVTCETAVTAALTLALVSGASESPTTVIHTYPDISAMAVGDRLELPLPLTCSQYLRVKGTGTTGKVHCAIEMGGKSSS